MPKILRPRCLRCQTTIPTAAHHAGRIVCCWECGAGFKLYLPGEAPRVRTIYLRQGDEPDPRCNHWQVQSDHWLPPAIADPWLAKQASEKDQVAT